MGEKVGVGAETIEPVPHKNCPALQHWFENAINSNGDEHKMGLWFRD
jgi:hypothetical protein